DEDNELEDDEEADEDDLGGAPRQAKRAKKARRAKRTDDDEAKRADDDEMDDEDLEDDDTTMRRAHRAYDDTDSEGGAWDDPSMAKYEQNSRQDIPRVYPGDADVHGRSNDIGFRNKVVVHGREVPVTDGMLSRVARRVARREGLNFKDPAARL